MSLSKNTKKRSKNNWKCILCGSNKRALLYKEKRLSKTKITPKEALCTGEIGARGRHAKIWKCTNCDFIFQEPSFSERELNEAYKEGEDKRYFEQHKQREKLFQRALERLQKYKTPPGKLLDIGSGAGLFVSVAKKSGWDAEGLDPSAWALCEAKKRFGVKVNVGNFENFRVKSASFDAITMFDVLEHYVDPIPVLKKARKLLKDDGTLALTTININSWFSRLLGSHWPWLIRVHLWYFTSITLTRMLERVGYEVEWMGGQTRWFSTPYLLSRLTGWNFSWMPNIILPAPTGDIIFVIARKTS